MTANIHSIEVVIDTEGNWNMTINIDSIEVVIHTKDNWNYNNKYRLRRGRCSY